MAATILVVEQSKNLRRTVREWLESVFRDCQVIETGDFREVVHLTRIFQPDVVLLGISLRESCGLELAKKVKSIAPDVEIVVSLRYADEADYCSKLAAAGINRYVLTEVMLIDLPPILKKLLGLPHLGGQAVAAR